MSVLWRPTGTLSVRHWPRTTQRDGGGAAKGARSGTQCRQCGGTSQVADQEQAEGGGLGVNHELELVVAEEALRPRLPAAHAEGP